MEISITAVTRNRKLTKSLIQHALALAPLKQAAVTTKTSDLPFDILQVVFVDSGADYMKAVGCKRDRLFQIEVAVPDEKTVDFNDAPAFVTYIVERLKAAVVISGLSKEAESQVSEAIGRFKIG